MARARMIRPEFFTDEKISELSFGAGFLFCGIWCQCDLRGVFDINARVLRGLIFPTRDGADAGAVEKWLQELFNQRLIGRFESSGKTWGYVMSWSRHQDISVREIEIGTRRPLPPGWADPPRWLEVIEKARKSGRITDSSPWNYSGTVPERFQNPTTSTSTSTTEREARTVPEPFCGADATDNSNAQPPAPSLSPGDNLLLQTIEQLGGVLRRKNENLAPEWLEFTKGYDLTDVVWIFKITQPAIRYPSEFHRAIKSRANEISERVRERQHSARPPPKPVPPEPQIDLVKEHDNRQEAMRLLAECEKLELSDHGAVLLGYLKNALTKNKPLAISLYRLKEFLTAHHGAGGGRHERQSQ